MIRACLFDMDGVLFDTERMSGRFMADAVAQQGVTLDEAKYEQLLGADVGRITATLDQWFPGKIDPRRFFEDWRDVTLDYMRENGMPLRPFAAEALRSLKERGYLLALCTSNTYEVTMAYLHIAGWDDVFDQVVTIEMVEHGKPAPDVYRKAAELLHVSPDECVGIEDSPNGLRAVRSAGMLSIMVPDRAPFSPDLAPYVDICLDSLEQLEETLLIRSETP